MRLIGGAQHSFDRDTPVTLIPDASVSPAAPITFIDNNGAMIHPTGDDPDPGLVDRDVMLYSVKAGYGVKGARIGSAEGEAMLFREDMVAFWERVLKKNEATN